ncbi:MAG: ABC transporter substrate-binding protein [Trueperaceae bacterium]|nr:ABC transporter substrate-binding protein [Trueperaceae bacterium]
MRNVRRILLALAFTLATLAHAQGATIDCVTDAPATITFMGDPVGNAAEIERETVAAFNEACPHITVTIVSGPASASDLLANYLTMLEGQSGDIDVMRVDVIWPGILAENLVDLMPYFSDEELAAHFPGFIQNNIIGDKMAAIAFRLGAGMLYYRTDLLERYGFDGPPATWDELEGMARTIQEGERAEGNADFWGFVWQGNNYEGLTTNALEWQVSEGGGSIVSPAGDVEVANDATIRAFERAAGWVGTISPPGVVGYVEDDARGVWHAGNAAFMRNWPYAYSISFDSEAIGDVFDVAALPAGASGTSAAAMGGWSIGVNRYSANVDAAVAFAKYFASYDEQKRRAIRSSINPTIAALYQDADVIEAVPFFAGLDSVFMGATPRPSTVTGTRYNRVSTLYSTAVHSILTGGEDAETALTLLELDLESLLGN